MELEHKVEDWLQKHGYPLEMTVAKAFREVGFDVDQSDYYFDAEISTYREMDVSAKLCRDTDTVHYAVNFLIECKFCKEYPWVVFKDSRDQGGNFKLIMMPGNTLGQKMTSYYMAHKQINNLPIFCNHESIGYAAVETLRSSEKKDNCYTAFMAISKALYAYSQKPKYTHSAGKEISEIFIPIIVIHGSLFESYLNDSGKIEIKEVNNSSVLWSNPVCGNRSTIIRIVTLDSLKEFAEISMTCTKKFLDVVTIDGKIDKIVRAIIKKKTKAVEKAIQST